MSSLTDIPKTMKGLVKNKEEKSYDFDEMPVPVPEKDEVLIKVDCTSVCGSDINLYQWNDVARVIADIPFTPGHETAGTVVRCGPDADIPVGTKVGVENHYFCGHCFQCRHDRRETCINMGQFGHGRKTVHGGCSEYTIVSAKYLYILKRNLSSEEIALLEPLGVSHNAIETLEVTDEDVLIIGCGPIGLLAISCAKALGAARVIATDIDVDRMDLAKKMGADQVVNSKETNLKEFIMEFTCNDGIGRICECSGAPVMVNNCFSLLRKGGHIVLVGLPKEPIHIENPLNNVVFKTLTLKTIHGRRIYHTWEKIENLVADGKVDLKQIISHRFPLNQFEEAFKILMDGKGVKIVLIP